MQRKSVLVDDLTRCVDTGTTLAIEIHHVFFGNANRRLSEEDGFIIPLTKERHTGRMGIHFNPIMDRYWKAKAQKYYEENLAKADDADGKRKEFIRRYGKSWLDDEEERTSEI